MNRYVCIHGHFYQPPRENPWLEAIEPQDSAYPYSNWNERITSECYAPNTASRILDSNSRITEIINNYSKMSFNFGPTLLSWMEVNEPETYQAILDADKESQKRFSGHGSALAQVYNHIIMPLANERDKRTQVKWGIYDFQKRFNRDPEGMWLSETAVDINSLEALSAHNIKFTILAPHQAKRVRKIGAKTWKDTKDGKVDPKIPYLCNLPSGRSITIFFYDGPVSHDIAFGDLLKDGLKFSDRMINILSEYPKEAQLSHIATDGETFGHHHRFGDMGLAYCLAHIEQNNLANITIYGEFLEKHPPTHEVEIVENTSWSCVHGIERWRAGCGCTVGGNSKWSLEWRKVLKNSMDWLRDAVAPIYEAEGAKYLKDPWDARDKYIQVVHKRGQKNIENFLFETTKEYLDEYETVTALKLMEMQRHAMLMYTSCGWFFDDISGIEAVQVLHYAARAIQLAKEVTGRDLEPEFIEMLRGAKCNIGELIDGAAVYETFVIPSIVDLSRVCAHYAISSLFEDYKEKTEIHCYTVKRLEYRSQAKGTQGLVVGRARVKSNITLEAEDISFAVSYLGEHNLRSRVSKALDAKVFDEVYSELKDAFVRKRSDDVVRLMQEHFGEQYYSLQHLFKSEQDKVLNIILDSTLKEIEGLYRQIYELHYPIMQLGKDLRMTLPKVLGITAAYILSRDLQALLEEDDYDIDQLRVKVVEAKKWSKELDKERIAFVASKKINALLKKFLNSPEDLALLQKIETTMRILSTLNLELNLWKMQNIHFDISKKTYAKMNQRAQRGDQAAKKWTGYFMSLEDCMRVKSI